MWNLNGEDIERAKEELKGRRPAIQARYDAEMKLLDTKIDELEAFERAAQAFVLDFKNAAAAAAAPGPAPQAEATEAQTAPAIVAADNPATEDDLTAQLDDAAPAPETERGRGENRSSRWRMRLGTAETSP